MNERELETTGQIPGLHAKIFDERKSNVHKYKEMTIGNAGWLSLLRYELTMLFTSQTPGALGLMLRHIFFKPLFQSIGQNVVFGRNLTIRHPHKIHLGSNVIIDDGCLLDAKGTDNEGIVIGDGFTLGRHSALVCKNGRIHIGANVNIGSSVKIVAGDGGAVEIGSGIDIGSSCHFSTGSYDYSQIGVLPSSQRQKPRGIVLEDLVWIGAGVIILDGVQIGQNSIIGAGAVVNNSIPPNRIAAGVPAKIVKDRDS